MISVMHIKPGENDEYNSNKKIKLDENDEYNSNKKLFYC